MCRRSERFFSVAQRFRGHALLPSKDAKIASEMAGHASVSITLDVYSHLMPDMQEKAAQALEEVLS